MNSTVAIARVPDYAFECLANEVASVLEASGLTVTRGQNVLVKPNLVNGSNARHCTTNPDVMKAACIWLMDHGTRVTVADSPAFGPASAVARASGLGKAMADIGLKVKGLKHAVPLTLTNGGTIGLSRDAMESDVILNVPKLKVHCQMTMSGAVKNMFGCVVGFRKAMAHNRLGNDKAVFRSMLMDVCLALPQAHHLMDAIRPLHVDGPISGEPFPLGMLAASPNPIAVDTAAYTVLGLTPDMIPLWDEALMRNLPGALPEGIEYPLEPPTGFDATGFIMSPRRGLPFSPSRVVKGRIRSVMKYFQR